jgi:predicted ATPase
VARADQLAALATEQGFAHWRAQGTIYRGWAKVKNGEMAGGTALLRAGSMAYRSAGSELYVTHYIDLQAAACEIAGQIDEALSLLDDALHRHQAAFASRGQRGPRMCAVPRLTIDRWKFGL